MAEQTSLTIQKPNLLSLTPELLTLILRQCPAPNLLAIARTCRRLNNIAVHVYLIRLRAVQGLETKSLTLDDKDIRKLRGLQSSITLPDLDRLLINFTSHLLVARCLEHLLAFISRSSCISDVTLYFGALDIWYIINDPSLSSLLLKLLSLLASDKCRTLDVRAGYCGSREADLATTQGTTKVRTSLAFLRSRMLTTGRWLDVLSRTRVRKRSTGHDPKPLVDEKLSLRSFHLRSDLLFNFPFYPWVIEVLRTAPINSLSLNSITVRETGWGTFLRSFEIPTLTYVAFGSSNIPLAELLLFVSKHPHLTAVDLPPHLSQRSSPILIECREMPKLPALACIGGYQPDMNFFMTHYLPFRDLRHFTFLLPPFEGDIKSVNSVIGTLIENHRPRVLTLKFVFPSTLDEFGTYADSGRTEMSSYPFSTVEDIRFRFKGTAEFFKRILPVLPPWLATFPALRKVSFVTSFLYRETAEWKEFLKEVPAACPLLRRVRDRERGNQQYCHLRSNGQCL